MQNQCFQQMDYVTDVTLKTQTKKELQDNVIYYTHCPEDICSTGHRLSERFIGHSGRDVLPYI